MLRKRVCKSARVCKSYETFLKLYEILLQESVSEWIYIYIKLRSYSHRYLTLLDLDLELMLFKYYYIHALTT